MAALPDARQPTSQPVVIPNGAPHPALCDAWLHPRLPLRVRGAVLGPNRLTALDEGLVSGGS